MQITTNLQSVRLDYISILAACVRNFPHHKQLAGLEQLHRLSGVAAIVKDADTPPTTDHDDDDIEPTIATDEQNQPTMEMVGDDDDDDQDDGDFFAQVREELRDDDWRMSCCGQIQLRPSILRKASLIGRVRAGRNSI